MSLRRLSTIGFARDHVVPNFPEIAEVLAKPQVREILDTIDERRGVRYLIMAGAQTIKSLSGQLLAFRNMHVEPGPSLWYGPSKEQLDQFCDEKPNPLFDTIDILQSLLIRTPSGAVDRTKRDRLSYRMPGQHLLFVTAGTEKNRQSKTARTIFIDEPWLYESGWLEQISRRRDAYEELGTWREIMMSTGAIAGEEIGGEFAGVWAMSDQRRWHLRCPKCERTFVARFSHEHEKTGERIGGVIYETHLDTNGNPDERKIAATVRHKCPHCGDELPDSPTSRLALSGTADDPRGCYIAMNPNPAIAPPVVGWQIGGVAMKAWTPMAIKSIRAHLALKRGDMMPLKNLVRLEFGDIFDPAIHREEKKADPEGDYVMFTPASVADQSQAANWVQWGNELMLANGFRARFAAVDVQRGYFVLVVRSWAADYQSRLFYAEKILAEETLALRIKECGVPPHAVFLDTRDNATNVRRICGRYGFRAVMGDKEKDYDHGELGKRIYSMPKFVDPWFGTDEAARMQIVEFLFSKANALESLEILRSFNRNDSDYHWSIAKNAPDWYRKEIDAYWRVNKKTGNGEPYTEFTAGNRPDHGADAEVINLIQARMADLAPPEKKPEDEKS